MKLTKNTKADFESYLYEWNKEYVIGFYDLPQSMQWGVYQDFFDSVGMNISVYLIAEDDWHWCIGGLEEHDGDTEKGWGDIMDSRPEARIAAIEKANEIYNDQR